MSVPSATQLNPVVVDAPREPIRAPACPPALALGLGIAVDRWLSPPWSPWILSAGLVLMLAAWSRSVGKNRLCAGLVLLLFAAIGGARHHAVFSLRSAHDVSRYATESPRLVELIGRVRAPVEIRAAEQDAFTPEWMRLDNSTCEIDCRRLVSGEESTPIGGRIRLDVAGHLLHAHVGDEVRLVGSLSRPAAPANPGAFDFRLWLRDRGIDAVVRADHPDAVQVLSRSTAVLDRLAAARERLRSACRAVLARHVRTENVPIAASLLLGDRTQMTDEISDQFTTSGTMHLLAVSGLHVSMLAAMLFFVCRGLHLSPRGTAALVLCGIVGYAFITDHRPPVMRAAVLAFVVVAALPGARRVSALNTLAISAIVVLLWNPTDLFDVGAQLSFLAVLGIVCSTRWIAAVERRRPDPLAPESTPYSRALRTVGRYLRDAYVVTAAIWLFTLPITIGRFNLVSPVGFAVNVALIPYSGLVLGSGFLLLIAGLLAPGAAWPAGAAFDALLNVMMRVIAASAALPGGHFHAPGPPEWWIGGCYGLLGIAGGIVLLPRCRPWAWRGLAVWIAAGLAWGLRPQSRDGLTCTFLAVGHGGAIALELPEGATLMYDTGTLGSPVRARRSVESALWSAGVDRIDAVIVSHVDMDHFNGVSGVLQSMPVGEILLSQSALDFRQSGMAALCDDAAAAGVPVQLIHAGDRLMADENVALEVLHPPGGYGDELDNANSIVLRIEYAGRTILLTGDLEDAGLRAVLEQDRGVIDVLQSPHHGSRAANPPELAAWARPAYAVISTGDHGKPEELQEVYGDACRVLSTAESGAIRVRVSPEGELHVDEYRIAPW